MVSLLQLPEEQPPLERFLVERASDNPVIGMGMALPFLHLHVLFQCVKETAIVTHLCFFLIGNYLMWYILVEQRSKIPKVCQKEIERGIGWESIRERKELLKFTIYM